MTPSDSDGQRGGPEAHEDDPTGIRALLASLPDPGPMPQDLVERIEARLVVEQAHRERGATGRLAARSDSVIDLAAERSHRRPGRTVALLGAAAAGLLVATVAIGELSGVGPGGGPTFDSAAQVPARSGAGADSADGGGGPETGDAAGADSPQGAAEGQDLHDTGGSDDAAPTGRSTHGGAAADEDGDGFADVLTADVLVLPQLGPVDLDDYRDRVVEAADAAEPATLPAGSLTEAGARWCWQAAEPAEPWDMLRAAEADLRGDRVVVLLGTPDLDTATGEALVLPWACTAGEDVQPLDAVTWATP